MADEWKEVAVDWLGDSAFTGRNKAGGSVQMGKWNGQPGITPMEMLLLGLAGCTGVDIVSILQKKRQNLEKLQVKVSGKRASEFPRVYTDIEVTYLLWGMDLDPKGVEQAIHLSEEKYCSASAMLSAVAKIHSSYQIFTPGEEVPAG